MRMAEPECLVRLRELKAKIDQRIDGGQVTSVGHRGRSLQYSETSVNDMIRYYNQLWQQCPAAQAELPQLVPLDQHVATRGRPAVFVGSGRV